MMYLSLWKLWDIFKVNLLVREAGVGCVGFMWIRSEALLCPRCVPAIVL